MNNDRWSEEQGNASGSHHTKYVAFSYTHTALPMANIAGDKCKQKRRWETSER